MTNPLLDAADLPSYTAIPEVDPIVQTTFGRI